MDFRRNQEDMVGFNPQIRASAFSKPLLPPTASLLSSPRGAGAGAGAGAAGGGPGGVPARNNGVGSTATSDVFDPVPVDHHSSLRSNPDSVIAPAAVVSDGLLNAVAAATPTTLTGSSTSATTKDCSPSGEPAAKYRECLRNHAASLGGHVLDGCGDFMPGGVAAASGGGGDPLKCAACGCHRSFHRKEVEGEHSYFGRYANGASPHQQAAGRGRLPLLLPPPPLHHHPPPQQWLARSPSGAAAAFGGNYSGSGGATTESSSEEHPGGPPQAAATAGAASRKRFRSKFTTEQKKRMLGFAESVGWRMQKQDEAAVEQFCAEVGVRRQVLKVWMHNNKHTMRKQHQPYHDQPQQHPDQQQQPLQIQEQHHQQQQPQHRPQLQPQQHTQPQQQHNTQPQQQQQQQHSQPQQHTQPQQPQQHSQSQQQQHRPQPQPQQHPHHLQQQQHPHHPQQLQHHQQQQQ